MSCFLCDSVYHLSHNCDVYESDESRQEALVAKNVCPNCFSYVSESHAKKWERCRTKNNKKCYMCFSRDHLTIFCPERYTAPNMIVPAIDKDLHKRFFRLFDGILEQYHLAFLSQEMFERINTWQNKLSKFNKDYLRVTYRELLLHDSLKNESDAGNIREKAYQFPHRERINFITNDVILKKINLQSYTCQNILTPGLRGFINFTAKKVILQECEICDNSFLRLLSNYTKILECKDLILTDPVKFVDVIKRVPNIEELILEETNIFADEFWVENLLKFKSTKNFLKLKAEIHSFKFNIENLVNFIKTKCTANVSLNFNIIINDDQKENRGHKNELLAKLSEYFEFEKKTPSFLTFNILETDESNGEKYQRMFASFTKMIEK